MTTTHDAVTAFYASMQSWDFAAMRRVLHDDLDVRGPIATVDSADTLVASLARLTRLTKRIRVKHLFVDGERACCVYDVITDTPIGASPVAEYFEVRDGRIVSLHAHFDGRPWAALFAAGPA
jgi:limonene-1,2-epoxide hydrolase